MVKADPASHYKRLILVSMIYLAIMLASLVLIHKTLTIHQFHAPAAAFVFPLWFIIGDIIAEVYGYKLARRLVIYSLIAQFIFCVTVYCLAHLKSSGMSEEGQFAYDFVTKDWFRIYFSVIAGVLIAGTLNAFLINKWRILLKGRYFWLRSVGASGIGEFIYSTIVSILVFYNKEEIAKLIEFTVMSFSLKFLYAVILAYPASFIARILRRLEGPFFYQPTERITWDELNKK